jgi:uncharacterized membrane protein
LKSRRQILIDWIEQDRIAPGNLQSALSLSSVFPSTATWQRFLDQLLLWLGALLLAAGVIFFFAYNWNDLGRFAKFALVEIPIFGALIVLWRIGLESMTGKATLVAAALFVGALLALVGQTYQTGADTFELFAAWAVLILPWVWAGRLAALWLVWIALLNLATIFYYLVFGGLLGFMFSGDQLQWSLFVLNTIPLAIWEICAARDTPDRWAIRILATASGTAVTILAIYSVADFHTHSALGLLVWAAYVVAIYIVYRLMILDVFVLAGSVLSIIAVITTWLASHLLKSGDAAGAMLLIGLIVIGLSAAGGWWLKQVVNGARS